MRRAGRARRSHAAEEPVEVKVNWQADKKDMVSFLFFNGSKIKDGRSPGDRPAFCSTRRRRRSIRTTRTRTFRCTASGRSPTTA